MLKEIDEKKKEIREERASVPSQDPSDRSKITTTSDRKYIVKLGPQQPNKLPIFPQNEDILPKSNAGSPHSGTLFMPAHVVFMF